MQCTRVGSSVSSMQYLSSEVIQGSCLGPLLFVIYINDVVKVFDEHCVLKMYMYANLPFCTTKFQAYLDKLATWSNTWQLSISCKKCSVLQVGKGHNNQVYSLASQPITATDVVKDLGVYVDKYLKFADHIQHIVTNASKKASLIHKCFISKDTPTMVHAFTVYVHPLLEYASYVWSPHLLKDIRQTESVQMRFTKRLVGMSDLDYCHRLATLGLESLELRHLHHDLLCTYKILSNRMDINYETIFTLNSQTKTRGHQWKLCHKHSRIDQNKYFLPSVLLSHGTV